MKSTHLTRAVSPLTARISCQNFDGTSTGRRAARVRRSDGVRAERQVRHGVRSALAAGGCRASELSADGGRRGARKESFRGDAGRVPADPGMRPRLCSLGTNKLAIMDLKETGGGITLMTLAYETQHYRRDTRKNNGGKAYRLE